MEKEELKPPKKVSRSSTRSCIFLFPPFHHSNLLLDPFDILQLSLHQQASNAWLQVHMDTRKYNGNDLFYYYSGLGMKCRGALLHHICAIAAFPISSNCAQYARSSDVHY